MPARSSTDRIVVAATVCRSLRSSPLIRKEPQPGFSVAMRTTGCRHSVEVCGLPRLWATQVRGPLAVPEPDASRAWSQVVLAVLPTSIVEGDPVAPQLASRHPASIALV
jgi:hypothetical protein